MLFREELQELAEETQKYREYYENTPFSTFNWAIKFARGGNEHTLQMRTRLVNYLESIGWNLALYDFLRTDDYGWCYEPTKHVFVRHSFKNQMFMTLCHEVEHALEVNNMGYELLLSRGRLSAEIRAESVAYLVSRYADIGGDILKRSADYLGMQTSGAYENTSPMRWQQEISENAEAILVGMGF